MYIVQKYDTGVILSRWFMLSTRYARGMPEDAGGELPDFVRRRIRGIWLQILRRTIRYGYTVIVLLST